MVTFWVTQDTYKGTNTCLPGNTMINRNMRLQGHDYSSPGYYFVTIDCYRMECRFGHICQGKMVLNDFGKMAHFQWEALPKRFPTIRLHAFQIMPNHMHGIIEILPPGNDEPSKSCVQVGLAPTAFKSSRLDPNLENSFPLPSDVNNSSPCVQVGLAPTAENSISHVLSEGNSTGLAATAGKYNILDLSILKQNCNPTLSDIIGSYKSMVANECLIHHLSNDTQLGRHTLLGKIWKRGFWDNIIWDRESLKAISRYVRNNPKKWNKL